MKKNILIPVFLIFLVSSVCWVPAHFQKKNARLYHKEASPFGLYSVEVYSIPEVWTFWNSPGSASDGPALVKLVHSELGVIKAEKFEMLQMAGPVEWYTNSVSVGNQLWGF
jgi:hypothetical protein